MVALRIQAAGAFSAPFWLSAFCATLMPTSIGYQDLAAFFARQPGVSERWRDHLIASPFGTIHAATFSFSRPIGTAMPEPFDAQPVNFDPRSLDVKARSADEAPLARPVRQSEYPSVNRRLKGDRMPLQRNAPGSSEPERLPPLQPIDVPATPKIKSPPGTAPRPKNAEQIAPDSWLEDARGVGEEGDSAAADEPPQTIAAGDGDPLEAVPLSFGAFSFLDEDTVELNTQLYFSVAAMGSSGGLEQWGPGAAPVPVSPSVDTNIKLSTLEASGDVDAGVAFAGSDNASRFKSPAERLGLAGKPRARAEKCVADAVYFEARGEPVRGQMAVAQVVMNRVFSGRYPNDVCGVVYQNANRHLACQFTFACEGKDLSRIDEPDMWAQAKQIAKDMLDGKIWLTEVGHATHYHAYWVHPSWVHEMAKLYKLGVHTFYRPRAWGDGSDAPAWSSPPVAFKPPGASAQNSRAPKQTAASAKKTHTARL